MANPFAGSTYTPPVDSGYNPFAGATSSYTNSYTDQPQPTFSAPAKQAPTITNQVNAIADKIPGVNLTEEDMQAREAALAKREAQIASREAQVAQARANGTLGSLNPHKKNFPPFFSLWEYYPDTDLPEESRPFVRNAIIAYSVGAVVLLYNWICCICCFNPSASKAISSTATYMVLSTVYAFVFVPISFDMSFFVLYNALKLGSGLRYVSFLITFGIYILGLGELAIGPSNSASVGFITMIDIFKNSNWVGVMALIFSILASLLTAWMVFVWIQALRYFKTTGLTKKAFGEASVLAGQYANDNKQVLLDAAKENPELAVSAISKAASYA